MALRSSSSFWLLVFRFLVISFRSEATCLSCSITPAGLSVLLNDLASLFQAVRKFGYAE